MLSFAGSVQMLVMILAFSMAGLYQAARTKTTLTWVWIAFCTGLGLGMAEYVLGPQMGPLYSIAYVGSAATCGLFWLVARALFRPETPLRPLHYFFVAAIMVPIGLRHGLSLAGAEQWLGTAVWDAVGAGISKIVILLSSTILVLSFWEGVRGWSSALSRNERRLRMLYASTYALCLSLVTIGVTESVGGLFGPDFELAIKAMAALTVLIVTGVAVRYRLAHPLPVPAPIPGPEQKEEAAPLEPSPVEPSAEDIELAGRIEARMANESLYLEPDLKVSSLARSFAVHDYRIRRAITGALGVRNFNQYVNAYRIEHAKGMLAAPGGYRQSILDIALDSGFASIGPFNRAFKASEGVTPREYRARMTGMPRTGKPVEGMQSSAGLC